MTEVRPVLEGSITLERRPAAAITLHLEGIDILQSFPGSKRLRSYEPGPFAPIGPLESEMVEHRGVILSDSVARVLALKSGSTVDAIASNSTTELEVVSIFPARTSGLDSNTVLVDVTTASKILRSNGALDRIDVVANATQLPAVERRIARLLPQDARIERTAERIASLERLTYGVRFDLSVLGYVALALGAVLVANSLGISVRQRRPEIAILRSLGASRAQIARAFLAEGALLGAFGGIVGALLGDAAGQAISGFAVPSSLHENGLQLAADASLLARGSVTGLLFCIGAAVWPSLEAASVLPASALRVIEDRYTVDSDRWSIVRGLAVVIASVVLGYSSAPGIRVVLGYASALGFLLGIGLCVPSLLSFAVRAGSRITIRTVSGSLAFSRLRAHTTRLGLAVVTLVIAVCASIGGATASASFERTTEEWQLKDQPGDLQIRLLGIQGRGAPHMLADRISRLPGVAQTALLEGDAQRFTGNSPLTPITVLAKPGVSVDALRRTIVGAAAPYPIEVRSSRESRAAGDSLFRPSLSLAAAVGHAAVAIAVVSAAATMIALIFEQRRELILLRIMGLSVKPMHRMIVYEVTLLAAFGALLGVAAGLGLGALLVLVIDPLVSGYHVSLELPFVTAAVTPIVIVAAAMLAAIVPARLATSKSAARGLQAT